MLKYTEAIVGFSEVPEEIALCINISGCPIHCKGCHSPHLWQDIGIELKPVVLSDLIAKNQGITCIAFMGGDSDPMGIETLAKWVKDNTELKVCWYSGKELSSVVKYVNYIDYLKVGPYIEDKGGIDKAKSNQKFYKLNHKGGVVFHLPATTVSVPIFENITYKFRNNEADNKSKSAD